MEYGRGGGNYFVGKAFLFVLILQPIAALRPPKVKQKVGTVRGNYSARSGDVKRINFLRPPWQHWCFDEGCCSDWKATGLNYIILNTEGLVKVGARCAADR